MDARLLLPYYGKGQGAPPPLEWIAHLDGVGEIPPCELAASVTADGTPIYFLIAPQLYERLGTPYSDSERRDWADNDIRFARLSLAATQIATGHAGIAWQPDLVHANDWPAALTAGYLAWRGTRVPVVFTIHNLAYQGIFPAQRRSALLIPESAFSMYGVEFYGNISLIKAGLVYAGQVTTVSPTYAREITTPEFGCGLHGLLADLAAAGRLSGITNGIGEDWSPDHDPYLLQTYPPQTNEAKKRNAEFVRERFGIAQDGRRPLFAMVSRFVHQKGVDLAIHAAERIAAGGGQFVLLGEGDRTLEESAMAAAERNPDLVGVEIAFDEGLSRRVTAASDFYLMPSRFEPCGLNQMYAQRYGSLPIANATGGLADTIRDGETGFLFHGARLAALDAAVLRAFRVYLQPERYGAMRDTAMARDFSWGSSATAYESIYRRAAPSAAAPAA
jgi:starch synthase